VEVLVGGQDVHRHLVDVGELLLLLRGQGLTAALPEDQVSGQRDLADLVQVACEEDLLGDHRAEHLAHLPSQLANLLAVLDLLVASGGLVQLHQQVEIGVVQFQSASGGELFLLLGLAFLGFQQ